MMTVVVDSRWLSAATAIAEAKEKPAAGSVSRWREGHLVEANGQVFRIRSTDLTKWASASFRIQEGGIPPSFVDREKWRRAVTSVASLGESVSIEPSKGYLVLAGAKGIRLRVPILGEVHYPAMRIPGAEREDSFQAMPFLQALQAVGPKADRSAAIRGRNLVSWAEGGLVAGSVLAIFWARASMPEGISLSVRPESVGMVAAMLSAACLMFGDDAKAIVSRRGMYDMYESGGFSAMVPAERTTFPYKPEPFPSRGGFSLFSAKPLTSAIAAITAVASGDCRLEFFQAGEGRLRIQESVSCGDPSGIDVEADVSPFPRFVVGCQSVASAIRFSSAGGRRLSIAVGNGIAAFQGEGKDGRDRLAHVRVQVGDSVDSSAQSSG
jgi:hypothetical protein